MARTKLSETRLASLRPGNRRYDLWDSEVPGLIVQVTTTGHLSYMLCRRMPGKRNPTRRLIAEVGSVELEQARDIAREWNASIRRGIDPAEAVRASLAQEQAEALSTFAAICEDYIGKRVVGMKRAAATEREVRQLSDLWGKLPLPALTRAKVVEFIEQTGTRSPSMAYRQFGHLRAMFNWLRERGTIDASPCDLIRPARLIGAMEPRQRTLTDKEVRAFWIATGAIPYPHGPLHRLVLLTGTRLREAADAEWREFDLTEKVWRIPPERTKTRTAHVVPLSREALKLLRALPRTSRARFLFTAPGQRTSVKNFHTPKTRIDAEMAKVLGHKPEPWVVHDLRRVVRSRMAAMGVREEIAERVLGHGPKTKIVRTYNTYDYLPEVRDALEKWGKAVSGLG